jgi:GrpB-like predicted nucleotidyltransferase (UPF0157 family)
MPVDVVEYNPAWPQEFAEQRDRLTILLRGWLAEPVEHVGSTAVPGLASKPIVDILAPVTSLTDARGAVSILKRTGASLAPRSEQIVAAVVPTAAAGRANHHLYLIRYDDAHVGELRAFRDALCAATPWPLRGAETQPAKPFATIARHTQRQDALSDALRRAGSSRIVGLDQDWPWSRQDLRGSGL